MNVQRFGCVLGAAVLLASGGVTSGHSALALTQSLSGQAAIPGVLAAGAAVELVQDGYANLDGAVRGPDGSLYFSDPGAGETLRLKAGGTIEVFSDQNNGATGLGIDPKGRLIALEGIGGRVVAVDEKQNLTVLASSPQGGPRYLLNDLVVDTRGGIYFTDAAIRSQGGDTRASRVLYLTPAADTVVVTSAVKRPTGIVLSVDGKTLLIADSDANAIMAMDVTPDGKAANLRPWAQLSNIQQGRSGAPEGLAIDSDGRLYVATAFGVQVYSQMGEYLGVMTVPRIPSNLAFGGADRKTLYITARSALYRIQTLSAGPANRAK